MKRHVQLHTDQASQTGEKISAAPDGAHAVDLPVVHLRLHVLLLVSQVKALYGALSTGSDQVMIVYFKERGDVFIEPLESHHTNVTQPVVPHLDEPILVASHGDVSVHAGAAVQGGSRGTSGTCA